jgi:hypothetical protein
MSPWKPKLKRGIELADLPLSPEEAFVALRLNGSSDAQTIAKMTGLPSAKVAAALTKLVSLGVVPHPSSAEARADSTAPPQDEEAKSTASKQSANRLPLPKTEDPEVTQPDARRPEPPAPEEAKPEAHKQGGVNLEALKQLESQEKGDDQPAEPEGEAPAEPQSEEEAAAEEAASEEADRVADAGSGQHRQYYENNLKQLTADERAGMAGSANEPDLSALCFDPLPEVIRQLVENPYFKPIHARLVAMHHRTPQGLEALMARGVFANDSGVRRAILKNPMLSMPLMRRLFGGRRLIEQFRLTTSRDLPEQTRRVARELMRQRFATADADDRVEVIIKTEGRCLAQLIGLPVDGKTASRLCGRTYSSTTLVQNIARWAAAPPALIAHLIKQEIVRRSPTLRTLLQRHPNAPTSAKQ